ncbi:MAG: ABC transporter ATP-binding protein [Bdellovibrionales bacterium]|nr:ABC transporter ATP-binding protein [Bdellovibrionales bacterium]
MKQNILSQTFENIKKYLPARYAKKMPFVFVLLSLMSIIELFSLGMFVALIPFIYNPKIITQNVITRSIYHGLAFESYHAFVFVILFVLVVLFVAKNLLSLWISRYLSAFSFQLFAHFTTLLQRYHYARGYLFMKNKGYFDCVRDIAALPGRFSENLLLPFLSIVNEIAVLSLIVISIFIYAPKALLFVAIFVIPPFFIFYIWSKKKIQVAGEAVYHLSGALQKRLYESLRGFVEIKTTRSEERFLSNYAQLAKTYANKMTDHIFFNLVPTKLLETSMIFGFSFLVVYTILYKEASEGLMLLGVFTVAAYRTMPSINRITLALLNIKGHEYVFDILKELNETNDPKDEVPAIPFEKSIILRNVEFSYPSSDLFAVRNINIKISRGDYIGIVGPSGSGKSTLIHLILGFLEPTKGEILIDQQSLNANSFDAWLSHIAYVPQEVFLFDTSFIENITLNDDVSTVDKEKLSRALSLAQLDSLVNTIPDGMQAMLGENGTKLSVGQKQRIGIARAIYSDAKVLVLDEITSALDSQTERDITDALEKIHRENLTVIIIAHRWTTLKHCNSIIELSHGIIKDTYSYIEYKQSQEKLASAHI